MTDWKAKGDKPAPARKKGALVEQAAPLSIEDCRTVYRRRVRETAIADGQARGDVYLLDRMLVTLFWMIERRELPRDVTLAGAEWEPFTTKGKR